MFPYFIWQQPTQIDRLDQRNAARLEDEFYTQYGALAIEERVRKASEVFAFKEKSNCKVKHPDVKVDSSALIFRSVGR